MAFISMGLMICLTKLKLPQDFEGLRTKKFLTGFSMELQAAAAGEEIAAAAAAVPECRICLGSDGELVSLTRMAGALAGLPPPSLLIFYVRICIL